MDAKDIKPGDIVSFEAALSTETGTVIDKFHVDHIFRIQTDDGAIWYIDAENIIKVLGHNNEPEECKHKWKKYIGFTDTFYYCTLCNNKDTILDKKVG